MDRGDDRDESKTPAPSLDVEIMTRHDHAQDRGLPTYIDPTSGFSVFTADFLSRRGECCGSGCRHCPFVT